MLLKIVQLSDIHIGAQDELTFEANSRHQFDLALARAAASQPDLLILSGDLCLADPVAEIYPWVKEKLDQTAIPYEVIAGNHDDSVMLAKTFNESQLKDRELYYSKRINGHLIVFLDSGQARFSDMQWNWLTAELNKRSEVVHVFMHHPPIFAGVPFLDHNHAFIERDRFIDLFSNLRHETHVFCGHYHTARYIQHGNIHIHICPSTLFQMDTQSATFGVESTIPGIQLITLDSNRVETQVLSCLE